MRGNGKKISRESTHLIISSIDVQDRSRSTLIYRKKYVKSRTITFTNHEREEHRIFIKPGQKWRWPFVKGALDLGFQPTTACRLSSARNCLFAVKVSSLFLFLSLIFFSYHSTSVGFTFGPRPRPSSSRFFFPRLFSRARQSATNTREGFALPSTTRANVSRDPRRDGTSRVFRTRTWLAHLTSAIHGKTRRGSKIFFHLSAGERSTACVLMRRRR